MVENHFFNPISFLTYLSINELKLGSCAMLELTFFLTDSLWPTQVSRRKSDTWVAMFRSSLFTRPFGLAMFTPHICPSSPLLHSASPRNQDFRIREIFRIDLRVPIRRNLRISLRVQLASYSQS